MSRRRRVLNPLAVRGIDPLARWSEVALAVLGDQPGMLAFRSLAIVHTAILDAASGVKPPSCEIAVAAAAHEALAILVPHAQSVIGAAWDETTVHFAPGAAHVKAMEAGRKAASARMSRHAWANASDHEPALFWAHAVPFLVHDWNAFLRDSSLERPVEAAIAEIHEVCRLGGRVNAERTADQTAAAIFWSTNPAIAWGEAARAAIARRPIDLLSNARILALVAMAMADSQIVAWRLKSLSRSPRPIAVIRGEAPSRIHARSRILKWSPLLASSAGAEFPCASCLAGGAAAGVLRELLHDDAVEITVTSPTGLTRTFASLSQMLQEAEDARVWAGQHFRSSAVESTELGLRLGKRLARQA